MLDAAWQWRQGGRGVAFAVVTEVGGSSPRSVGARLAVCDDGAFAGSVSGGCVEAEVVGAAMEVIGGGKPQTLTFAADADGEWRSGLSCGGAMTVFVHLANDEVMAAMREHAKTRRTMTVTTNLKTGKQTINETAGVGVAETAMTNGDEFVETILPARRLFVVGATHIAQCILPLAATLEMECIIIDPRAAWTTAGRFGDAKVLRQWGDEVFSQTPPDGRDAVIALTHDPKIDDPALVAVLKTKIKPGYIGALGSCKTHDKRLTRLRAAGVDDDALLKIHAPIGFDIGAKTPGEIAVAIIAEVIAVLRGKQTNRR